MKNGVKYTYPVSKKLDNIDNYFGTKIKDPYRWLEDPSSVETKKWVDSQNQFTEDLLSKIIFRSTVNKRLAGLLNFEKVNTPLKVAGNYFVLKKVASAQQESCYIKRKGESNYELLIDVQKLSTDNTVSINKLYPSKDGKYLAYAVSEFGSDLQEFFVLDITTNTLLPDHIKWINFSPLFWFKDGFFYSSFSDQQDASVSLPDSQTYSKVFYHKIGTHPKEDILIYEDKDSSIIGSIVGVTDDDRFLFLLSFYGTKDYEVYYRPVSIKKEPFIPLFKEKGYCFQILSNDADSLIVFTNFNAPNFKIVKISLEKTAPEFWDDLVPEKEWSIYWAYAAGGKYIIQYLKDLENVLEVYNADGVLSNTIPIPSNGSVRDEIICNWNDSEVFIKFESTIHPPTIYKYEVDNQKLSVQDETNINFNYNNYISKRIFYTSKDGTTIPMFITHKKGIQLDGSNPTLLYGYGGFRNSNLPSFDASRLFFLEQGGIYAVAHTRGGGEYGEEWYKAGKLDKKQNVFDDFIAAAEYLKNEQYTSSEKLAITGRSNGGLLVGAVINQRPDLFKVAIPIVGVMDMLRYHKFTLGRAWSAEYGNSEVEEQFNYLVKYSPLHNIEEKPYPATLVLTADHDDRVVPAHSYKYVSTLQEKQQANEPVVIRIESNAGHGSGKSTQQLINEWTDIWSFVMYHLNMNI